MGVRKGEKLGASLGLETSLDDIAADLGITREGARQVQNRALRKVRAALEERGITAETWFEYMTDLPWEKPL